MVNAVIQDLIEIDPNGEAFRFPHARNGNRFLQETSLINVRVFADALDSVGAMMEAWIYEASNLIDEKREEDRK